MNMLAIAAVCCSIFISTGSANSGSLFDDGQELISPEVTYPDYAVIEQSVSGGDAHTTIQVLTSSTNTSGIESALQEQLLSSSANSAAMLAELQAISAGQEQAAENYLTAAIVDVMDRVVRSHPFCRYIGYRTSLNNATDGTLIYGIRSSASPGSVTIYDGYKVDYYRYQYQSGYQTYYEYRYTVTPFEEFTVAFGSNTLVYTNALSGYPTLGINYTGYLIIGLLFIAFFLVLLRRH